MRLTVQKCCCCLPLRTAALILGWLGILGSILTCIAFLQSIDEMKIAGIVVVLLFGSVDVLLIFGALKRKHNYVLPKLIIGGLQTIFSGASLSLKCFDYVQFCIQRYVIEKYEFSDSRDFVQLVLHLVLLFIYAIGIYFWIVLYSFYKELRASNANSKSIGIDDIEVDPHLSRIRIQK